MRALTTLRSVSDAGSNTSLRRPPPNSGRNRRSPGLVSSNCNSSSRTCSASDAGAAVRPSEPMRNGKARWRPLESAMAGSSLKSLRALLGLRHHGHTLRRLRGVEADADAGLEQHRHLADFCLRRTRRPADQNAGRVEDTHREGAAHDRMLIGLQQHGRSVDQRLGIGGRQQGLSAMWAHHGAGGRQERDHGGTPNVMPPFTRLTPASPTLIRPLFSEMSEMPIFSSQPPTFMRISLSLMVISGPPL